MDRLSIYRIPETGKIHVLLGGEKGLIEVDWSSSDHPSIFARYQTREYKNVAMISFDSEYVVIQGEST